MGKGPVRPKLQGTNFGFVWGPAEVTRHGTDGEGAVTITVGNGADTIVAVDVSADGKNVAVSRNGEPLVPKPKPKPKAKAKAKKG